MVIHPRWDNAKELAMAHIVTRPPSGDLVKSLSKFIEVSGAWHDKHARENGGMLSDLWYRGVNEGFPVQVSRVYREKFTKRAKALNVKGDLEAKRLHLERVMISQFKTAGAPFLAGFDDAQIYMTAQHYGMPTRLLDWSTNPLAALFFACAGEFDKDGYVYAMDAGLIIPDGAKRGDGTPVHRAVMTTRHPYVQNAIAWSFWAEIEKKWTPHVLPVRPDSMPGRIGQQSSCFTFHMHGAAPATNPTSLTIRIDRGSKRSILNELHRANINQFTTYHDLDHLSKEMIRGWGCD